MPKKVEPRFWIGGATRDHVLRGVEGGFCQLSHGRPEALRRMRCGDWIVYYSGRDSWEKGSEACQRFTALGKISGDEVYQVKMRNDFHPFRRDARFCRAKEIEIHPLIPKLSFIKNKKFWGLPFRRGYLEVSLADFRRIASPMLGKTFDPTLQCQANAMKKKKGISMVTNAKENKVVTLVNVFTVEPKNQDKLVRLLVEATEKTMNEIKGFVSANIHKSFDGTRVTNYAQWKSREDFETMIRNPAAQAHMKPITDIATFDAHLYEVIDSFEA